jgi:hypothetical protein
MRQVEKTGSGWLLERLKQLLGGWEASNTCPAGQANRKEKKEV